MSTISSGTTSTTTLIHSGDTTGSLVFKTNDTGSGGTTAMTIDTSQQVGIGTSTNRIGERLHVLGYGIVTSSAENTNMGLFGTFGSATQIIGSFNNIPVIFRTNNTEQMRIDTSGNVGIGTTSPNAQLDAYTSQGGSKIAISHGTGGSYPKASGISFGATSTSYSVSNNGGTVSFVGGCGIYANNTASSGNPTDMVFWGNSSGSPSEYMRLTNAGVLVVNATSASTLEKFKVSYTSATNYGAVVADTANGGTGQQIVFYKNGSSVGAITSTNTATAYGTSSDYRLKEDIAPMTDALAKVKQLKPVTYKWKSDGSDGQGFIAHELQAVVPDCVTGEKDAVDADGNPVYQGVDTSFLVATLVAAIQEQQTIIEQLRADVAALKGA